MLKKSASYTKARLHNRRQQENEGVQALSADIRSMSTFAFQDLSSDTQERFAVKHFIDSVKDRDDRLRLWRDKSCAMDKALSLACELETFHLLDNEVNEVQSEPDFFKVCNVTF